MRISLYFALLAVLFSAVALPPNVSAQEDEIIVTASRQVESPGIFIEKRGDFLLLEVRVENDSREVVDRLSQMTETIDTIIRAAKKEPDIVLSLVDENNFVRPLSRQAFIDNIRNGQRPDTSFALLKVKTDIPENVTDSYKLASKLGSFINGIKGSGRTKIINYGDVAVSILNPYQYRNEVRNKVISEMKQTTLTLGDGYVMIPQGLDGPVRWARSGDLNLAFFMRTSYKIYPKALSIELIKSDEWQDDY